MKAMSFFSGQEKQDHVQMNSSHGSESSIEERENFKERLGRRYHSAWTQRALPDLLRSLNFGQSGALKEKEHEESSNQQCLKDGGGKDA